MAAVGCVLIALGTADEYDHRYAIGDHVKLWVNKVGPYNNPQETYNYFELPFCKIESVKKPVHKWGGLGEVLEGNELIDSNMDFKFRMDQPKTAICSESLSEKSAKKFTKAIKHHYWYEFFMDDLPIWGFVGEYVDGERAETEAGAKPESQVFIYTHKSFEIGYNNEQIIMVNLTAENPRPLTPGTDLEFTYSIKWEATPIKFGKRFERYLDYNFFEHQIHWFSIFNSFMMVIFLTGLVSMILMRTLRNDYAKYAREEDDLDALERDVSEESGWKLVHGDVFRPPRHLPVLSALIGTGVQMCMLILFVILITIAGMLYEGRGAIITVFIVCYALTSFVGGYVSGGYNARNEGKNWIKAMLLTAGLFPGLCFGIAFSLNTIAISYHSLAAVPFGTMVVMFLMWAFISFPLVLFGTVIGRNWNGIPDNPCRVKTIPRPIPERQWYLSPVVISIMGGLLPFGSIFIETYFVFTSIWNYKVYYVYGFFLLVFLILIIVTLCVTIVGTYFLLNAENYHWHWTAYASAASISGYVYVYSIYYFAFKTKMTGFFQTCFYFGYTAMFCLGLGIMCGAIGYVGANSFVRRIYRNIKCD
uniref:Transmembrane 9 superfamily member n=1 Tax=Mantoniella antarctica TaxID=81844 RepID=A0A7S0SL78_9CHLO